MFSHISVGVSDFARAFAFYDPILSALGQTLRFKENNVPWAAWNAPDGTRPLFIIMHPFNGNPTTQGNGSMTAFLAPSRKAVDQIHALAVSLGGTDEGAPALRPQYHSDYYGAYFRDPDGNKLCVVCHHADPDPAC